jgi:hypothetical protein
VSYQVNFRLFVPNCSHAEAEKIATLQKELHDACAKIIFASVVAEKQVGLTAAEVVYLK